MVVEWTTMTIEAIATKAIVRYIICHDQDAELSFRVTVEPMGASVHISVIREDYMGNMCTTHSVPYD